MQFRCSLFENQTEYPDDIISTISYQTKEAIQNSDWNHRFDYFVQVCIATVAIVLLDLRHLVYDPIDWFIVIMMQPVAGYNDSSAKRYLMGKSSPSNVVRYLHYSHVLNILWTMCFLSYLFAPWYLPIRFVLWEILDGPVTLVSHLLSALVKTTFGSVPHAVLLFFFPITCIFAAYQWIIQLGISLLIRFVYIHDKMPAILFYALYYIGAWFIALSLGMAFDSFNNDRLH